MVDPVGRVFHREGRVFRAISPPYGAFVRDIVARAPARGWLEAGLVPTWTTDLQVQGFETVVEHKRIPFVTLRGEWSGEGLRAAALCILQLQAALLRDGLCLKDAHPWNVLFDGPVPRFIDWGSIRPASELNREFWYQEFRRFLLAPLYLFSRGRHRLARTMLREHSMGAGNELIDLPALRRWPRAPATLSAVNDPFEQVVDRLADYVEQLRLPDVPGEWEKYPQPAFEGLRDMSRLRLKDRLVHQVLENDPGKTLLDIGTNGGLHALIGVALGKTALACDIEETCLNRLYLGAAHAQANVLPLYHDFLWPIGESGLFNAIPGAMSRLRCDTVLAMAITHHIALRYHVSLESIADNLHRMCRRRLIVEFVPAQDVHVATWSERFPDWYRLEVFVAALSKRFADVTVLPSDPAPRVVLVCEGARGA
ncbi:hypothetical protein DSM104440_03324 [Usitatibacter palustris]|uniref:Nodulation protein NoeA n=2 Tax=Usitatibacter palustris TaxID=2732487 RepID=A0A6M4H9P7_9PROT|nr:hypothetical protein DSM104440_03324 [Usitatibacter palustris]